MTYKEMCEFIVDADVIRKDDDSKFTPEEIWNLSPTGELWPIFELYDIALAKANLFALTVTLENETKK